jgi:hypothetical protein
MSKCTACYEDSQDCVCRPCSDCGDRYPILLTYDGIKERCNECHTEARAPLSNDELWDDWVLGIED